MVQRSFLLIGLFLFVTHLGLTQNLDSDIQKIIKSKASEGAIYGISVVDKNGKTVYSENEQSMFIPASTLKLITTFSSILSLGKDYRYETKLGITGKILKDGTLHGDLVVTGAGDPSLGCADLTGGASMDEVLKTISSMVSKAGIKCIDGRLIIDISVFDDQGIHPSWSWDDLTNYYASGAYGLNINENLYRLGFKRSSSPHSTTEINSITPFVPGLIFEQSRVRTGAQGSGDNAYIYGDPYNFKRWTEGTIPPGQSMFYIKGAIPQPAEVFAYHLRERLKQIDITVNEYQLINDAHVTVDQSIGSIKSISLAALVKHANSVSQNMFCEAFLKTMGANKNNDQAASFDSGLREIERVLESNGMSREGWKQVDGSGLSARNRISPSFMTSFLYQINQKIGSAEMRLMIPKTGAEGSVRRFLSNSPAQGNAWLKSGSINHVLCYTGLLKGESGQDFFIAVMANGHQSNRLIRKEVADIITSLYINL